MNSPPSVFPTARVAPNSIHAFGGIWRLGIQQFLAPRRWLMVAGMLVVFALFSVANVHDGHADHFLHKVVRGNGMVENYLKLLVPIIAFVSAAGAIREDLKPGSVDYIFTRPVHRPAFVVFRYLVHVVCVQMDFILALAVLIGAGIFRHLPDQLSAVPLLLLAQELLIVAFSAFGMFCGLLTSRYVLLGLFYGTVIEVGIGHIPTQLSRLSMTRQVWRMLQPLIAAHVPAGSIAGQSPGVLATTGLLLAFSALMLGAAAVVCARREWVGGSGRDA